MKCQYVNNKKCMKQQDGSQQRVTCDDIRWNESSISHSVSGGVVQM